MTSKERVQKLLADARSGKYKFQRRTVSERSLDDIFNHPNDSMFAVYLLGKLENCLLKENAELISDMEMLKVIIAFNLQIYRVGFLAYVKETTGSAAERARILLRKIGAERAAAELDGIAAFFPSGKIPEDLRERTEAMNNWDRKTVEKLSRSGKAYMRKTEDIIGLLRGYMKKRRAALKKIME